MSQSTPTKDRTAILSKLVATSSSSNDNEALTAIRLAHKLAQAAGLDLVSALTQATTTKLDTLRLSQIEKSAFDRGYEAGLKAEKQSNMPPWQDAISILLRDALALSPKEYKFVESLSKWQRSTLSEKQNIWLADIWRRVNPSLLDRMADMDAQGGHP